MSTSVVKNIDVLIKYWRIYYVSILKKKIDIEN